MKLNGKPYKFIKFHSILFLAFPLFLALSLSLLAYFSHPECMSTNNNNFVDLFVLYLLLLFS